MDIGLVVLLVLWVSCFLFATHKLATHWRGRLPVLLGWFLLMYVSLTFTIAVTVALVI